MKTIRILLALCLILIVPAAPLSAGGTSEQNIDNTHIAVFVPGIVSGSPVYEMLTSGVRRAVDEASGSGRSVELTIIEAGTRQADWGTRMMSLVAEGSYSLIITSNPAMPELIEPISRQFPRQQFLVFDAWHSGNPAITTFRYNQREQAYISGYIAALVSTSAMEHANGQKKIGLVAGQEYPAMNGIILPAYREGARAAVPDCEVDFRVVGNWYDATRGAELARAMHNAGVDVIMPIAGGANQGIIAAARDSGFYISWFDDNGFQKAPGLVVSSSIMAQERLAYEKTLTFLRGTLQTGEPVTLGIRDGYVSFIGDDPLYLSTVPESIRNTMSVLLDSIANGTLSLPVR